MTIEQGNGVWKDPWALPPKSGLERILARVIS